jgi:putative inorganic carbon (HCO3(-)) transporter
MIKLLSKISSVSLFITILLIPFYFFRFKIHGLPTNVLEIAILLTALLVLIELIAKKQKLRYLPIWSYLFLLTTAIGYFLADDKTAALGIIKGWFVLPLILGWVAINKLKKEDFPKIAWAFLISGLVIALWAIAQKFGLITTLFYQKDDASFAQYLTGNFRVFGPFESPNYLAMFLVPMAFLSLPALESSKSQIIKFFCYFAWFLTALAIFFSGSRAGLIALFLSPVLFILASGKVGDIKSLFLRVSLMIVAFAALAGVFVIYGLNPGSDSARLEIYKYSLKLIKAHPYLGIGFGNFQDRIGAISSGVESFRLFALPYALHPHNLYLAIWLYQGALGLIFFLLMLVSFLLRIRKQIKFELVHAAYFSALVAILLHGLFDTTYFKNDLSVIFWLSVALGLVMSHETIKSKIKTEDKTLRAESAGGDSWWQEFIKPL